MTLSESTFRNGGMELNSYLYIFNSIPPFLNLITTVSALKQNSQWYTCESRTLLWKSAQKQLAVFNNKKSY